MGSNGGFDISINGVLEGRLIVGPVCLIHVTCTGKVAEVSSKDAREGVRSYGAEPTLP